MRLCRANLCLVVALCGFSQAGLAQSGQTVLVDRAVLLYDEGRFEEAEITALRALQDNDILAPVDRARLRRILGFTYVVLGESEKAKRQFIYWLELDPLARLDPLYISPKIISVFQEAQQEYNRLKAEKTPPDYTKLDLQMKATRRSLLFPGLGQLYQGQQVKGLSLLASEVVLLSAFAYCQINYDKSRDRYLSETNSARMQSLYDDCNLYYRGRYASAILAAGVYLYSLFDVMFPSPGNQAGSSTLSLSVCPGSPSFLTLSFTLPPF